MKNNTVTIVVIPVKTGIQKSMDIQKNISLKKFSSWKTGGSADFFCQPSSLEEIFFSLKWAKEKKLPITILSGGTNVLISDQGIEGLVLGMQKLNHLTSSVKNNRLHITAQAGVPKAQLMQIFLKHKLAPALFLCGLPGDVGGGVVMNAGISAKNIVPKEFGEIVKQIKVIQNNQLISIDKKDLTFKYRCSTGWMNGEQGEQNIIYEAAMSWPMDPISNITEQIREMALKRSQTQPLQSASCGSVFKNPAADTPAGFLIDQCQLKGYTLGKASVSEKHANFIVNQGGATAQDIHNLIVFIQEKVKKQHNISLQTEVKYLGRWNAL